MTKPSLIRPATPADARTLAELARRTFLDAFSDANTASDIESYVQEAFSLSQIQEELADASNSFFLAMDTAHNPMGYAKLRTGSADPSVTGPDPIELHRLYVGQSAIGHGVGAALMQAVLKVAKKANRQTLWLGVWERNPRAISFYERWGFEVVGDHVFRLGSDDQRDLIMQRAVLEP